MCQSFTVKILVTVHVCYLYVILYMFFLLNKTYINMQNTKSALEGSSTIHAKL